MAPRRPRLPQALVISDAALSVPPIVRLVGESAATVEADPETRAGDTEGDDTNLRNYWVHGKGAAKIRWGTDGDFDRCVRHLKDEVTDPQGLCAEYHHDATGKWPGKGRKHGENPTPPAGATPVRETPTVVDSSGARTGRLLVQLIRAGWSLNGNYYPADVLRRDGATAWPVGTLNYVDHDTDDEEQARPSGSLLRLASYQTSPARWDEQRQALVAEVRVFAPWRETVADWAESGAIGMSVRAWVYGEQGEAEGRTGFVVSGIPQGKSCDYVTVPAAGGAILSVLESVRHPTTEAPNLGAWLESRLHLSLTCIADDLYGDGRLTRRERITLSQAIGDGLKAWTARVEADAPQLFQRDKWVYPEPAADTAEEARRAAEASADETRTALHNVLRARYGATDHAYVWVRDFDPDAALVWFDVSSDADTSTWQHHYAGTGAAVALAGGRTQVTVRTVYQPVPDDATEAHDTPTAEATGHTPPVGDPPAGTTHPEEEPAMSGTQTGSPPGTATVPDTGQTPTTEPTTPPPTPPVPPQPTEPAQPAQESTAARSAVDTAVLRAMEALTAQVTQLTERVTTAEAANRAATNGRTAREAVDTALRADTVPAALRAQIGPRVTATILANVPTTTTGDVDTTALGEAITAAITAESGYAAALLESAGVGLPTGLGEAPQPQTAADFVSTLEAGFVALGMTAEAAKIAARGRS